MSNNMVEDYGWENIEGFPASEYILPKIIQILGKTIPCRIVDLGCGKGKLCAEMALEGHYVIGLDSDKTGIAISRRNFPHIKFYNFGVQDSITAQG